MKVTTYGAAFGPYTQAQWQAIQAMSKDARKAWNAEVKATKAYLEESYFEWLTDAERAFWLDNVFKKSYSATEGYIFPSLASSAPWLSHIDAWYSMLATYSGSALAPIAHKLSADAWPVLDDLRRHISWLESYISRAASYLLDRDDENYAAYTRRWLDEGAANGWPIENVVDDPNLYDKVAYSKLRTETVVLPSYQAQLPAAEAGVENNKAVFEQFAWMFCACWYTFQFDDYFAEGLDLLTSKLWAVDIYGNEMQATIINAQAEAEAAIKAAQADTASAIVDAQARRNAMVLDSKQKAAQLELDLQRDVDSLLRDTTIIALLLQDQING